MKKRIKDGWKERALFIKERPKFTPPYAALGTKRSSL